MAKLKAILLASRAPLPAFAPCRRLLLAKRAAERIGAAQNRDRWIKKRATICQALRFARVERAGESYSGLRR
jgi:hypothetical protein